MNLKFWNRLEGFLRALEALSFPLLVAAVLRYFTHHHLGIGIVNGIFLRKLMVPLLVIYFLGFYFSYRIRRPLFRWSSRFAIACIFSALGWYKLSVDPEASYRLLGVSGYVVIWFFLGGATLFLSFATTIDVVQVWRLVRQYPNVSLLGALSTAPLVLAVGWEEKLGGVLARVSSFFSCQTLKLSGMAVSCAPNIISHRIFTVLVNPPCSGIDVLSLFVAIFCLFSMLAWDLIGTWRMWLKLFAIGLLYAFSLNILRLNILFIAAIRVHADRFETSSTLALFHHFHGLVLYSIFLSAFFLLLARWLVQRYATAKNVVGSLQA